MGGCALRGESGLRERQPRMAWLYVATPWVAARESGPREKQPRMAWLYAGL